MSPFSYVLVGLIGALVGIGELVSRHKDAPLLVLKARAAWVYVAINVGAALGALTVIDRLGWTFGQVEGTDGVSTVRVLVAGFGAMALLRSSLFTLRIGDAEDAQELRTATESLEHSGLSDEQKLVMLGLLLIDVVGADTVLTATRALGKTLARAATPEAGAETVDPAQSGS